MYQLLRPLIFLTTSILVSLFFSYLNLVHILDVYRHWFCMDFENFKEYDYVVVGAGSAGSVLSARLAENGYTVLLIEAGGAPAMFLDIPLLAPAIQKTPNDWQYVTLSQQNSCKALIHNQSRWPMGKVLGGTSRLNYMVYLRGHPLDYHGWFPDYIEPTEESGGSMKVNDLKWSTEFPDVILNGIREMGERIGNINEDLETGFMKVQLSMEKGSRWSTDKILYQDFKDRLAIMTHARAEKVLMKSGKAVGVQFVTLNKRFKAMARNGVVLSAGTVGSPKILMLSGIGPRKHLDELKINVIRDLPVGQNLMDHVLTGIDLVTLNVSFDLSMTNALNPLSALNYFLFGEGPWTSPGVEVLGTFHSSLNQNKSSVPDLQLMIFPLGISTDNGVVLKEAMGISDKVFNEYFAPLVHENAVTIAPVLLHPKSVGEVKLRSNGPFDDPLIDPKYLSHDDDVATLIDGIQFVKRLVETRSMKSLGATVYKKHIPGCEHEEFDSTEYWECYVRHLTLTAYHPVGTCRMGDVVDKSFRVHGTTNLYVVDASVLPSLPSGNINAAVLMLAEKAARILTQRREVPENNRKCRKTHDYCDVFNVCDIVQRSCATPSYA